MGDKQKQVPDSGDKTKQQQAQSEATAAHGKLLGESGIGSPPGPPLKQADSHVSEAETIRWPGGGKRTFERDEWGHLTKVLENDGTHYERDAGILFKHMKHEHVLSEGQLTVNEKTNEMIYFNHDNNTVTTMKADGSSVVRKHLAGQANDKGPAIEIHNPPKADGTAGDVRKFTYDDEGHMTGYSVISANKNLCSNWKTNDGVHWRKVDDKGQPIKDSDPKKDEKNVLVGRMYVSSNGTFAFDNQRKGGDEAPHWTVVNADGTRHERITKLDKPMVADAKHPQKGQEAEASKKALEVVDTVHALQADVVKAHFDEIKSNNPAVGLFVGAVDLFTGRNPLGGAVGRDEGEAVLNDANRTPEQKLTAAVLKKCMDLHGVNLIMRHELDTQAFQDTLAKISLDDLAYDQVKKNKT